MSLTSLCLYAIGRIIKTLPQAQRESCHFGKNFPPAAALADHESSSYKLLFVKLEWEGRRWESWVR